MIGIDEAQYIQSEKLRGIVVTHRDYEQLRDANPDETLIIEESRRIKMVNAELKKLEAECAVIVYKKMKHLDMIRTHISNIGLITSFDIKNRIIPQFLLRLCGSIQKHSDDLSFYVMKIYEPDYRIAETVPEEKTIATGGPREINVVGIMKEMDFSDELSRGADRIYRDGLGVSNIFAFCVNAFSSYSNSAKKQTVNHSATDVSDI